MITRGAATVPGMKHSAFKDSHTKPIGSADSEGQYEKATGNVSLVLKDSIYEQRQAKLVRIKRTINDDHPVSDKASGGIQLLAMSEERLYHYEQQIYQFHLLLL
jgi:hypothetical protein